MLGLAFKPNTDDVREAPSLDRINTLCDDGAIVSAYDPEAMDTARPNLPASVQLVDNVLEAANQAQAIVLVTEWSQFVDANWQDVARCMNPPRFVFDGRNALDGAKMQRLGFQYVGVGRNATAWVWPRPCSESFRVSVSSAAKPLQETDRRKDVDHPPGPGTVCSVGPDNILPSPVQIAPVALQSVVAGRVIATSPLPSGRTVISQRMLRGRSNRRALITLPPVTVKASSRSVT